MDRKDQTRNLKIPDSLAEPVIGPDPLARAPE
jgi:hypothetical protein